MIRGKERLIVNEGLDLGEDLLDVCFADFGIFLRHPLPDPILILLFIHADDVIGQVIHHMDGAGINV